MDLSTLEGDTTVSNHSSTSSFASKTLSSATSPLPDSTPNRPSARPDKMSQQAGASTGESMFSTSHGTLGQLSYGPATQTTVVTTTTTTTTSLAPIVLKPSRHLNERDPKMYPLASTPTPQSLRRISFNIGGHHACFREADSPEREFHEYNKLQESLQSSSGSVQTTQEYDTPYKTSASISQQSLSRAAALQTSVPTAVTSRKRPTSPVSIVEATAKIVGQDGRIKRRRYVSEEQKTGTSGEGHSRELELSERMRYKALQDETSLPETPDTDSDLSEGPLAPYPANVPPHRPSELQRARRQARFAEAAQGATATATASQDETNRNTSEPLRLAVNIAPSAGMSATPPIAENDLDAVSEFSNPDLSLRSHEPSTAIDTNSPLDASLPSPSASPVTASASLSRNRLRPKTQTSSDSIPLSLGEAASIGPSTQLDVPPCHDSVPHHGFPEQLLTPNPLLPTPSLMDIPTMIDSFDALPAEMQTYIMYQLLKRSSKPTIRFVADTVNPALKCDFLGLLPLELSMNIVKHFDRQTMCRAAQVSKKWRRIIDSDERAWKDLLDADDFELPEGELEKAIKQGWGWQHPHGHWDWERDISGPSTLILENDLFELGLASSPLADASDAVSSCAAPGRPKRKAAARFLSEDKRPIAKPSTSKRMRRKFAAMSKNQSPKWIEKIQEAHGPNAFANAAALAVPHPKVGLPSLKNLHLFKSLYQRHFLIRNSWMSQDIKPHHIAFRAHHRHVVTCLQFDTDKILTGSDDTNINVYDTKTGALRCCLQGHEGGVWALQYEGNTLVSGSTDRSVRIWDIEKGRCTQVFQGHTSTVRCLQILKPTEVGKEIDGTPIMMPKETLIITGSRDSSLRVWKMPQKGQASIFQAGPSAHDTDNQYFVRALIGHHHSVRAIAAHADTLVSGSYDCTVRVWKISTGELLHRLQGHSQKVYSVVLDHTRGRCISGSMDNQVKVWSLESGTCLFNLDGHSSLVGLLDLSHGRLVSAAADSTLRIWDPESGLCRATLKAHSAAITCFQHDDQKVISGSDRTLKMWDIKTGKCIKDLLTDLSGVWQVKFNDRRCVAAVQRNNLTYIEVLDFGATRDGMPAERCGRRIVVDEKGNQGADLEDGTLTSLMID
ncbi:MAG: SCF ubiquitin ligase complex subunit cdc4 [Bathelium mastoideum]|nr:MAG: SCF ubiquitin ligase complex subunit cdc4 [Bathelium mastoideum]